MHSHSAWGTRCAQLPRPVPWSAAIPLALGHEGERLNVDGDRAAAAVAAALHADTLVIMTNVPGLLANADDNTTLIRTIAADQLPDYMGCAQGRMRKKLLGAQEALQGGVSKVCIGSASLLDVLNGAGTTIAREHEQEMPTLVHDIPGERNHR